MANSKTTRSSLRSVAQRAGLSVTTVHQVLNNKGSNFISEETRKRVRQVAEEMGYRPNIGYKLMRGEKTRIVAVLASTEHLRRRNPFTELIVSLVDRLDKLGYVTYFSILQYSPESNLKKIRELLARGAEHFIMVGNPIGFELLEEEIAKAQRTLVCCGNVFQRQVSHETVKSKIDIFRFFLDRGHRNIKCLCQESLVYSIYGYLEALKTCFPELAEAELVQKFICVYPDPDVHNDDISEQEFRQGIDSTRKMLAEHPQTDAIFYANDTMALGGVKYLFGNGYQIGSEILVAGFYNLPAVQQYCLPISSIAYDLEKVEEQLLKHAFDDAPCHEIIPTITYIRE